MTEMFQSSEEITDIQAIEYLDGLPPRERAVLIGFSLLTYSNPKSFKTGFPLARE